MEFFARISQLVSSLDAELAWIVALVGGLLPILLGILAILKKRKYLLLFLVFCMPFAGFVIPAVDATATLLRWTLMISLALSCVCGFRSPGPSNLLLGLFGILNVSMLPVTEYPGVAIQFTVLWLIMTWMVSAAIADEVRSLDDVHSIIKILVAGAVLFVALAMFQLPLFRGGGRFSGSSTGAPVFVITGGLLLPVTVWAFLNLKESGWRTVAIFAGASIAALTLFSGQRTGTYAGLMACLPVVWRFSLKHTAIILGFAGILIIAVVAMFSLFPNQATFAVERYSSLDVTGREIRWRQGWEMCTQTPLIAHGIKPHVDFHNAFFEAWYRGGIQGLVVVVTALGLFGWQSLKLCFARQHRDLASIGRLCLGIFLFVIASSMPEDKLISPSNMTILMTMLFGVIVSRCTQLLPRARGIRSVNNAQPVGAS